MGVHGLATAAKVMVRLGFLLSGLLGSVAIASQDLTIIGYSTLSGPAFGVAMRKGADTLVDEINRNPNLLPGYTVHIAWQDTRCSSARARSFVLRNLFQKEYVMFAPGTPTNQLDINHDGVIAAEETETFEQIWNTTSFGGGPVGIIGPTCSGAAMEVIPVAYRARLPMVSGSTTFPGLSDRTKFPNFYRTVLPDTSLSESFVHLTKLMGHTDIVVITGSEASWADQAKVIAHLADREGVTLNGIDFTSEIPLFKGYRVESPTSIQLAVSDMVKLKKRIIVLLLRRDEVVQVLCYTYKAHFTTGVYMAFGWLSNSLWSESGSTSCSAPELSSQVQKALLATRQDYWRSDSSTVTSCTDNVTVTEFYRKWVASMNATLGDKSRNPDGYGFFDEGATYADAVCFLALMYHELLFNQGFAMADLIARTQAVYDAQQSFLGSLAFEGMIGRIQFQPGVAEPSVGMTIVQAVGAVFEAVGSYNNGQLTFHPGKSLEFKLPGETFDTCTLTSCGPGILQHYNECPNSGEVLNFSSNTCGDCPTGSSYLVSGCVCDPGYYGEGSICQPCEAGTFSRSPGQQSCEQCPAGQFAIPPAKSCRYCEEGKYANATGTAMCTKCPARMTTVDVGSTSLTSCNCSRDHYYTDGSPGCLKCPNSSRTSQAFASRGPSSCLCQEDYYMDGSECQKCPVGSSTLGGGKVSVRSCLCPEGHYMPLDWSKGCQTCPEVNHCPLGSNVANLEFLAIPRSNRSVEQRYLDLAPRHWSTRENPVEVFFCGSRERCPGGRSPGDGCADRLLGIACEHCEAEFFWDGKACERCEGHQTSVFLFPMLPLLICPLIICVMYRFLGDPIHRLGSWANTSWALAFVLLNYLQTLGTMADLNMAYPSSLQELLNVYSTTQTAATNVYFECYRIRGIVGTQAVRGCYPAGVVVAALVAWAGSRVAAKVFARQDLVMETNRTMNTVGTVFFNFYHALMGVSLMVFKCTKNPEPAPATLAADLSVVCWTSDTWKDAMGIGVACLILYIVGLSGLWVQAIWKAPKHFGDLSWRTRWKFLFVKWESGRYGWGVCYMLRNFLFNLVPCVFIDEAAVMYLIMTIIAVYVSGIVLKMPFRTLIANYFEIFSSLGMFVLISLLTWWADRVAFVLESRDVLTTLAMSISCFPVVLTPLGFLRVFMSGKRGKPSASALAAAEGKFKIVQQSLEEFTKLPPDLGQVFILNLEEPNLSTLKHAAFLITTDVFHRSSRRRLAGGSGKAVCRVLSESQEAENRASTSDKPGLEIFASLPLSKEAEKRASASNTPVRDYI